MQYITEIKYHSVQNGLNTESKHKLQQPVTKNITRDYYSKLLSP